MKEQLINAIADMKEDEAIKLAQQMLDSGVDPREILDAGKEAMKIVGDRFEHKEYFLPELIVGGDILKEIGDIVKPRLEEQVESAEPIGKVVMGTVEGDIHDIGKDVVGFMLDIANFEVHDLGVDVPSARFVEAIRDLRPDIVGMSGFLTLAFDQMKGTVDAIREAGLRDQVKIMIGGATMDDAAAIYVGADAYGADATAAVKLAKAWVGGN
jgi:5-methyltetrahydrofolate--homocysteine methyltransferase